MIPRPGNFAWPGDFLFQFTYFENSLIARATIKNMIPERASTAGQISVQIQPWVDMVRMA